MTIVNGKIPIYFDSQDEARVSSHILRWNLLHYATWRSCLFRGAFLAALVVCLLGSATQCFSQNTPVPAINSLDTNASANSNAPAAANPTNQGSVGTNQPNSFVVLVKNLTPLMRDISAWKTVLLLVLGFFLFVLRKKNIFFRWGNIIKLRLHDHLVIPKFNVRKKTSEKVKYGIGIFQDSILPLYFDYVYKRSLERHNHRIEFVQFEWANCFEAFQQKKIDVALHNVSAIIPFHSISADAIPKSNRLDRNCCPSLFFPFYDHQGLMVFIQNSRLQLLDLESDLKDFKLKLLQPHANLFEIAMPTATRMKLIKKLLQYSTCAVEPGTDASAAIERLYEQGKVSHYNLIREPSDEGFKAFTEGTVDVFCGGLGHAYRVKKLIKERQLEATALCKSSDLNVLSCNGLVTTADYATKNPQVIRDLVDTWFWSIREFNADVINQNDCQLRKIVAFLNEALDPSIPGVAQTQIEAELLKWMVVDKLEEFHEDAIEIYRQFYGLKKPNCQINNILDIAKIAAQGFLTEPSHKDLVAGLDPDILFKNIKSFNLKLAMKVIPEAC